ncbi:hypothetical protein OCC79_001731 [Salmonella enterica]|nr:hypothetical protein [Salmonella enterica]EKL3168991.1 hypothetical protein [Salmonella enterica]
MGITSRLKVMSFLQYFIWGSWHYGPVLGLYLTARNKKWVLRPA